MQLTCSVVVAMAHCVMFREQFVRARVTAANLPAHKDGLSGVNLTEKADDGAMRVKEADEQAVRTHQADHSEIASR